MRKSVGQINNRGLKMTLGLGTNNYEGLINLTLFESKKYLYYKILPEPAVGCSSARLLLSVFYMGSLIAKTLYMTQSYCALYILSRPLSMGNNRYPSALSYG